MSAIQFSPDETILDIREDHVFKAVFATDTPASRKALTGLLSAILDQKLEILSLAPNEAPGEIIGSRQIRFDINVKLQGGELANVEMTKDPKPVEVLRMEYYLARLHCSQKIQGSNMLYQKLAKSWQISILGNNLFSDPAIVHCFVYYDKANDIFLGGRTAILTLELNKAKRAVKKPVTEMSRLERWSCFFRYGADRRRRSLINKILAAEEGIAVAGEVIQGFTEDEIKYFNEISREKYRLDRLSMEAWYRDLYEKEQQVNTELTRRVDALEQQKKSQEDELNLLKEKLKQADLV
jgi:predicted transposase/invertase (TIGR01784 family)